VHVVTFKVLPPSWSWPAKKSQLADFPSLCGRQCGSSGEKANSNKPEFEKANSNKPEFEKANSNKPKLEKANSNKPKLEKANSNKPTFD